MAKRVKAGLPGGRQEGPLALLRLGSVQASSAQELSVFEYPCCSYTHIPGAEAGPKGWSVAAKWYVSGFEERFEGQPGPAKCEEWAIPGVKRVPEWTRNQVFRAVCRWHSPVVKWRFEASKPRNLAQDNDFSEYWYLKNVEEYDDVMGRVNW